MMSALIHEAEKISKEQADALCDTSKTPEFRGWPLSNGFDDFEIVPGTDLPEPPKTDRADYTPIIATAVALAVLLAVSAYRIFF